MIKDKDLILINLNLKLVGKKKSKNIFQRLLRFFTSNPYVWETLEDIEFEFCGDKYIIPKGFRCDLASVPQFLQNLLPTYPPSIKAYIVHDWLYINEIKRDELGDYKARKLSDIIMLEIANKSWDNKLDNYIRYFGVRVFGWIVYKR